jgi:hypothetical protein
LAPAAFVFGLALAACEGGEAAGRQARQGSLPAAPPAGRELPEALDLAQSPLGAGLAIWESDRLGAARIFGRPLDGGPERPLSREEPGRVHCCAHFSPDGSFFVYLSLPPAAARYPREGATGELRRHDLASGEEKVLVARARTYFEHRAVVFRDAGHLVYIGEDGRSRELELAGGASRPLIDGPTTEHGWLPDPTYSFATQGTPTFSPLDAGSRQVRPRPTLGGCQPYFTAGGLFGYYVAGAGGPIRAIELASGKKHEILRKGDPRLPAARRYLYFPMISSDRSLLAWGASDGGHDHFSADYEIFLAEIDSQTLELVGAPLRVSNSPAADRFPDVWAPAGARPRPAAPPPPPAAPSPDQAGGLVVPGEVLAFRGGDYTNLVLDAAGREASTVFEPKGRAWYDRDFALELRGGSFLADMGTMQRLLDGLKATNEMSLELLFEGAAGGAAAGRPAGRAVIFSFSAGRGGSRNFTLALEGSNLVLQLLTESNSGERGATPRLEIPLGAAPGPRHVVFTYSPGELVAYVGGREAARTGQWREGFFPWRQLPLLFGNDWEAAESFHGKIYRASVKDRAMDAAEASRLAAEALAALAERQAPPVLRVEAALVRRSRTPALEQIAPYRQALAVYEYRALSVLEGTLPPSLAGRNLRVVHRVLADGEELPIGRLAEGAETLLALEPFKDQPQLEAMYLSDQLEASGDPLFFSPATDLR